MLERKQPLAQTCSGAQCAPPTGSSLHVPHPAHSAKNALSRKAHHDIHGIDVLCTYLTARHYKTCWSHAASNRMHLRRPQLLHHALLCNLTYKWFLIPPACFCTHRRTSTMCDQRHFFRNERSSFCLAEG